MTSLPCLFRTKKKISLVAETVSLRSGLPTAFGRQIVDIFKKCLFLELVLINMFTFRQKYVGKHGGGRRGGAIQRAQTRWHGWQEKKHTHKK